MFPFSCDPGYAELGVQEGVATLRQQAELFGINSVPPVDLPAAGQQPTAGVIKSTLATLPESATQFPTLHRLHPPPRQPLTAPAP